MKMNKRLGLMVSMAALVAGCASGVKLDEGAPVEDRNASGLAARGGAADASGTTQSRVAPVAADNLAGQQAGPVGVARLVYFDYDSYVIKPEYLSLIDGHARYLKADAKRRIAIEGHTDERGGREYNLALGQKRSEAVRRALAQLGVSDSQVEAVSFGKEKPAVAGNDEAAFAKNRRAEIVYR